MSTFVLVPGAGGSAWYWSRVVPLLDGAGHTAVAVDLPGADDRAGLAEYTELVLSVIGDRDDVILVAQSLGGFTAAMVCQRARVESLVLVNAMIPVPGETPGEWWDHTGAVAARSAAADAGGYGEFDLATYFFHDVAEAVAGEAGAHDFPEADRVFASPCEFTSWPSAAIRVLTGADDRFVPAGFQREVAQERLGLEADVLPGGHLIALGHPESVAGYLLAP